MQRSFCDKCDKALDRNMVDDRLVVEAGEFQVEVIVSKKDDEGTWQECDGDLCMECLLKMLTTKPKRKYVRKQAQPTTVT